MFKFSKSRPTSVLLITELVKEDGQITSTSTLADKFGLSSDFIANLMAQIDSVKV